ncbi:MAG: hypothetical protein IKI97_09220 [Clostridia bacterium]|nr:hypothetical protein [Clostridia bacterium]
MQKDINVSSDDNKEAVSPENLTNDFSGVEKNSEANDKFSSAMEKLDAMFAEETEDLAWLDNILNDSEQKNVNTIDENSENEEIDDGEGEAEAVSDVIEAENADEPEDADAEDDVKIFTPAQQNTEPATETVEEVVETEPSEIGFDAFEGDGAIDELTDAEEPTSDVNHSLGKLFGLEDEDDDKEKEVKRNTEKQKSEHKKIAGELGAYTEIDMSDERAVKDGHKKYSEKKTRSLVALAGTTLFFVISLYLEIATVAGLPVPAFLGGANNHRVLALVDLQMLFFGAMFILEGLVDGFWSILDKRFSPASGALVVFAACTVQALTSTFTNIGTLFCAIGCLALLLYAFYEYLKASADEKAYIIASSSENKYGAYELGVDSLECSPFASRIDLENAKVVSVSKGSVYEGFVRRNQKRPEDEKKLGKFTVIIAGVAALVGIFAAIFTNATVAERIYDFITGTTIVLVSSVPFSLFFVSALPKYIAAKAGAGIGAALIGQNASEEYKGLSVVTFEDTEVFLPKDVRISSIKTYRGMALDEAVETMSKIYAKIGGPLSRIFAKMVDARSLDSDVKLLKVYPDAIEVSIGGRNICLATASYLGANGIRVITDSVDTAFEQSHGSILFMVSEDKTLAKFYIKYSMNPTFEKTLGQLHDANLCVGIKTLDPCITNDLVFSCLEKANYALSVIKGNSAEDIPVVKNKVNSGIIALGSVHSFLEMLLICERTGRNVKINNTIKVISAILCLVLSSLFVLNNEGSLPNITFSLIIQLFWLLPVTVVSFFNK